MSTFFVDTSSLAKRYVNEVGSAWVRSWTVPRANHVIVISDLTSVEMCSLLARHVREGSLAGSVEMVLRGTFLLHVAQEYLVVPLETPMLTSAQSLVRIHALRALDGIQLACALQAAALLHEPMTFVTGDNKLLSAAAAEGFTIDNPYLHP